MSGELLSRAAIEGMLPHRGSALFLTSARVEGARVAGAASWPAQHPHLAGHFPGLPIVPGVFLIEAAAQLAGVALAAEAAPGDGRLGMLAAVRKALVHRPVPPDAEVRYELAVTPVPGSALYGVAGTGTLADARKVVTVDLTIALADPRGLDLRGPDRDGLEN